MNSGATAKSVLLLSPLILIHPKIVSMSSSKSPPPPAKRRKNKQRRAYPLRSSVAPIFSTTPHVNVVPVEVWREHICYDCLNLKELSILRRCHTFFEKYWQKTMAENVIRVPQGCPTVEKAMDLAAIFSVRKVYTETEPLHIRLDEGVHEIVGNAKALSVTCSYITFVGTGKDHTTIRGGFRVNDQHHVKFEQLTVTNGDRYGLVCGGSGNVEVTECCVKNCVGSGVSVYGGSTVTATQCEITENGSNGVYCRDANTTIRLNDCSIHNNGFHGLVAGIDAVVDVHATKTDIHSNKRCGINAWARAKVNLHLPSQHNTSHDNVGEDRLAWGGGSIANINADGTFTHTHVVVEEEDHNVQ